MSPLTLNCTVAIKGVSVTLALFKEQCIEFHSTLGRVKSQQIFLFYVLANMTSLLASLNSFVFYVSLLPYFSLFSLIVQIPSHKRQL